MKFFESYPVMCRYYGALVAVILLAECEVMSFHIQLHPPTSKVSGLSRLYVQAPGKPKRRQQPFIETIKDNLFPTVGVNDDIEEKTEEDYQIELLEKKPWRDTKIRYLTYQYRPWKESYKERYQGAPADSDKIYLYGIPSSRFGKDRTRIQDIWGFPWLWTKVKADRLSWLHKLFYADVSLMTAQEHIEMDAFFSEYDMPLRWGLLRVKELDVLNVIALNLAFWTDFNGVKPTDLGLRPDGTLRPCPVQFHTCISSSNDPRDVEHYAPPFKWSRNKSPEQAYEEIKSVYQNYPKRGLKWSSGWIDRGGWKPQIFGDSYFYANGESLVWHYVDDIEFSLDVDKRLVQYRSSTRLGQTDWDVEKNRYNQFVRMLNGFGGWEVAPLEKDLYVFKTPFRWVDLLLTKSSIAIENIADRVVSGASGVFGQEGSRSSVNDDKSTGAARYQLKKLMARIDDVLAPLRENSEQLLERLSREPALKEIVNIKKEIQGKIDDTLPLRLEQVRDFTSRVERILPSDGVKVGSDSSDDLSENEINPEASTSSPVESPLNFEPANPFDTKFNVPTLDVNDLFNTRGADEKVPKEKTVINAKEFRDIKNIKNGVESKEKPWLTSNSGGNVGNINGFTRSVDDDVESVLERLDKDLIVEEKATTGTLNLNWRMRREPLVPARELRLGKAQLGENRLVEATDEVNSELDVVTKWWRRGG